MIFSGADNINYKRHRDVTSACALRFCHLVNGDNGEVVRTCVLGLDANYRREIINGGFTETRVTKEACFETNERRNLRHFTARDYYSYLG